MINGMLTGSASRIWDLGIIVDNKFSFVSDLRDLPSILPIGS